MNLNQKSAIVTGASRGIGAAIARRLAQLGCNIVLHYNENNPQALMTEIRDFGVKCISIQCDFATYSDNIEKIIDNSIREFGKIDILVNNAAVARQLPIKEMNENIFDHLFNVNVKATYFLCKRALEIMSNNGRIVNITGVGTELLIPGFSAYLATKGAIEQITHSLAHEAAEKGICINAISPGATDTDMTRNCNDSLAIDAITSQTAFGRLGFPTDIANAVSLLCLDESSWITGQTIQVNGGII